MSNRRREMLEATLAQVRECGFAGPVESGITNGGHQFVKFAYGGSTRKIFFSATVSDTRAVHRHRHWIRRQMGTWGNGDSRPVENAASGSGRIAEGHHGRVQPRR